MTAFVDLKAQFRRLEGDIRARMDDVLEHGKFIMGPEVAELEQELADFAGVKHAITCSSGTDALLMPLMAWGIGPGDAVFTTPFTFIATSEVISLLGATPVFVDVDEQTFNIDAAGLRTAVELVQSDGVLTPRAVIPVDLFGLPADYTTLEPLARELGLKVLEDAAQGFGGRIGNRRAGSFGHAAATSFFPAKPLGCYGDGGAIFTDCDKLAAICRSIRVHGKGDNKYDNVRVGLNARIDTLQAAILLPKLAIFADELDARQRVAARYSAAFDNLPGIIATPRVPDSYYSAWAQYTLVIENREALQGALRDASIPSAVYYPLPLHLQPACADLGIEPGSMPVSERLSQQVLSLPMHPYLEAEEQDVIIRTVKEALTR